jgi:peptidyl-dipeptidase Dcp
MLLFSISAGFLFFTCSGPKSEQQNPFFAKWETLFEVPPFAEINEAHYLPAYKEGMKQQKSEIEAIVDNSEKPTFENTIEALAKSGTLLNKVSGVFNNLKAAHTNDALQAIAKEVAPLLARHQDDINMNEKLFQRVQAVNQQKDELNLTEEQSTLVKEYYKDFVRGGANLGPKEKVELRKINEELSLLALKFSENILKEENKFKLIIEKEEDLAGLPQGIRTAAAESASEAGHQGKWVFTLQKPSMIPFLQYSEKRELREKIYKAYINRGNNNDELDNKEILSKMTALRIQKANLLGFKSHAHYVLDENMAKNPDNVYKFLDQLWKPALARAKAEANELQSMIDKEGRTFTLQSWDWWFYAEKVKKAKYDLDEEALKPYFELQNVVKGAFEVAGKLWDIQFVERNDIPTYHKDVKVYEVQETDGSHIGILYTDYYVRSSKESGAWMDAYRKQYRQEGVDVTPVICNVGNFPKPTVDTPSLISYDNVKTLFHEFGHGLHGLLSNSTYRKLSGTSVARDFVELPSQIMENWASEPEVLKMYAKHYKSGEPIPQDLIDKIQRSSLFNQGFETVEYLAACFLDMDWHTLKEPTASNPLEFEAKALDKIDLIPEIISRYRSSYFKHIFSWDYSSGYYSYIWAEVLDADAFEAFKERGLFDKKTADAYRKNILEAGGTEDPMILYKRFRGDEPRIAPLLKRRGLI